MAQYFVISTPGGRAALESHILTTLSAITPTPTKGHKLIRRLGVGDIWTTNYECLLEEAIPEAPVVTSEDDLAKRRVSSNRQITKMHGSLENSRSSGWLASPIITRSDYEQYEMLHPRMWASLKATYMTRTFLFLGFSFSDPNIEILLRLSRTLLNVGAPEHFTVIKKPDEPNKLRDHELKVQDLESSGIAVHEISAFADIVPLLERLVQRTRRERLFVSGSEGTNPADVREIGKKIGHRLAESSIEIVSLAGAAGFAVSFPFGYSLRVNRNYEPERIKFYFRQSDSAPPLLEQRMGTAVYTGWTREEILDDLLPECRGVLVLGGGERTMDEVNRSVELRLPVIPVPMSGGTAMELYNSRNIDYLLGREATDADVRDWRILEDQDSDVATAAVFRLVRRAMYLHGAT